MHCHSQADKCRKVACALSSVSGRYLWAFCTSSTFGPQIWRDHLLNLSISISRGKETNQVSPSNGKRSGKSSSLKSLAVDASELWLGEAAGPWPVLSKLTWKGTSERVTAPCATPLDRAATVFRESGCLGMQPKVGGKLHLKLTSECKPLWGKPERVHRNMKQNIQATESTYAQHN